MSRPRCERESEPVRHRSLEGLIEARHASRQPPTTSQSTGTSGVPWREQGAPGGRLGGTPRRDPPDATRCDRTQRRSWTRAAIVGPSPTTPGAIRKKPEKGFLPSRTSRSLVSTGSRSPTPSPRCLAMGRHRRKVRELAHLLSPRLRSRENPMPNFRAFPRRSDRCPCASSVKRPDDRRWKVVLELSGKADSCPFASLPTVRQATNAVSARSSEGEPRSR